MEALRAPEEVEKEMETWRVITLADIYRALRAHPEWTQELRKVLLTEELLNLPIVFKKFVEEEFQPLRKDVDDLKKKVDKIEGDVEKLKVDVEKLKVDVEKLKVDVEKLKVDVGWLKGGFMELQVRDRVGAFFGKLLKRARLLDSSDLADLLYDAAGQGLITQEEAEDALRVDAVVRGQLRSDGLKEVLIAAEISFVVDRVDVERAKKRAEIISRALSQPTIPAVIGKEFTEGAKEASQELSVLII
uniref:DUF1640 domain-containing protein n=1 Tax=Caldimicrobium thiodismutans TaxID=1653476 RepID=A0A832GQJ3_9BACT